MSPTVADAVARYEGTVGHVEARTPQAELWLSERLPPTLRNGRLWCVEDAEFPSLVDEMRDAGLEVDVLQAGPIN